MQLSITRVYPKPREFVGKNGPLASVKVLFDDGTEGDLLTTPDKAPEHIAKLAELVGTPHDFEIDPAKEREYNGVTQRALKSYPGKPQSGQGGGGRQYVPDYDKTAEGLRVKETYTNARTALMQAVIVAKDYEDPALRDIEQTTRNLFALLQSLTGTVSDAPKPTEPSNTRTNGQNASPSNVAPSAGSPTTWPEPETETAKPRNPRAHFFVLWDEGDWPDDEDYQRFVLHKILVVLKQWPDDQPLKSRKDLGEQAWQMICDNIGKYRNQLTKQNMKPMDEPEWKAMQEVEV